MIAVRAKLAIMLVAPGVLLRAWPDEHKHRYRTLDESSFLTLSRVTRPNTISSTRTAAGRQYAHARLATAAPRINVAT